MIELVELSNTAHKSLKVTQGSGVKFASTQQVIGLRANEVSRAATNFPVFFTKNARDGSFVISAMTSFTQGANLFVTDGRWQGTYQPSFMLTYPFFLMQSPRDERSYTIGFDPDNKAFSEQTGDSLFDSSGRPTDALNKVKSLLESDIQNDISTREFVAAIGRLDLFKQVDLKVHFQNGGVQTIAGVHTIDDDKLTALTGDQLADLNKQGYLQQIHGMLISIYQLNMLLRKHNDIAENPKVSQIKIEVARDQHSV